MGYWTHIFAALFGAALVFIVIEGARTVNVPTPVVPEATAATPTPPAPRAPRCLRERRTHIFGTYRASSYQRADQDLPVDLAAVECLEWEVLP